MTERKRFQQSRNQQTKKEWLVYSVHRRKVTSRIQSNSKRFTNPRIAILGAGNCNDIELTTCLDAYSSVTLMDLDQAAMSAGILRQDRQLGDFTCVEVDFLEPGFTAEYLDSISPANREFDVVASTCLLSQLIESNVSQMVSSENQNQIAMHTRANHLKLIMDLLVPAGIGMLITDFVSSDTCPDLLSCRDDQIPMLAESCLNSGNFFTGLNPFAIKASLVDQFGVHAEISKPWRWRMQQRAYLVTSIEFLNAK